jgi:hypothetical protein
MGVELLLDPLLHRLPEVFMLLSEDEVLLGLLVVGLDDCLAHSLLLAPWIPALRYRQVVGGSV